MHVPASEFAAPAVVPGGSGVGSGNRVFTPRTRCLQIGPIIGSMSIALWVIRFAGNGTSHWPIGGNPPRMAKPEEGHPNRPSQCTVTAFLCRDESDGGSENISFLPTRHAALPPDKNIGSDGRGADGYRVSGPSMRDCH